MSATPQYVPLIVPSDRAWMDPRLFAANLYTQITDLPSDPIVPTLVIPANPSRWAVGFTLAPPVMDGCQVGPWSDLTTGTGFNSVGTSLLWFRLPDYGTLVQAAWYVVGGAGSVVRAVEIIRR